MHDFQYKNGELYCEGVKVSAVAKKTGTPVYIYSHKTLVEHVEKIREAFREVNPIICYAMKANSNLAVLKTLVSAGTGFDIVSLGELKKAGMVGADMKKVVFASVGKTDEEIMEAIKAGILLFNVESKPELLNIERIAGKMKKKVRVALRINPDIDAPTHEKINTGSLKKKFGIDLCTARELFVGQKAFRNLTLNGVHIHIGSQITKAEPFMVAIEKALAFIDELEQDGVRIEYFNIGGGLGIIYKDETPQTAAAYAKKILPLLKGRKFRLIMEPGRFIAGNAGVFVTKVLYLKDNGVKKFLIVDGGMNDLVRPSMYEAYHEIVPVRKTAARPVELDVVGPICESGDTFAKARRLPQMKSGEFLAILSAGAYGYAMASNYNVRGRAAEVLVKGNKWAVVQERETFKDLVRGAKVPGFLR
ncbi:MAG: diaminopimelate decarboxylase [Elusimicrobia bacterium]|nr:diaminopimelate decarboxylase [Elusimicrobiota bacterium]